jgi:hypothetical protein
MGSFFRLLAAGCWLQASGFRLQALLKIKKDDQIVLTKIYLTAKGSSFTIDHSPFT